MTRSSHLAALLASLSLAAVACGGAPTPAPETAPPAEEAPKAEASAAPAATMAPAATAAPEAKPEAKQETPPAPTTVEVPIEARSKSKLKGTATFAEVDGGVKVTIKVTGAPPGKVATHVHETGDCSAPDAKSAGGHFNPEKHPHGLPDAAAHHLGDLGNIEVAKDGTGTLETTVKGANLKPNDPNSYLGKAIVVHEKKDDGGQPVGNAGGRIGCGVIAAQK